MTKLMKKSKRGFTLVELVIVIAILAIVAAIAIPTASNVIGNANKAADAANAQAIEMAIKTCQAEGIANNTNTSAIFSTLKSNIGTKNKLTDLLAAYGVPSTALTAKQNGFSFYYDSTSGKVVAANANPGSQLQLTTDSTIFKIAADNTVTIDAAP